VCVSNVKCDSTCLVTKSSTSPPGTGIKTWVPLIVSCKNSTQYQYLWELAEKSEIGFN